MVAGGEDPRFIARRIAVCAAEDVGNADPMATVLAASAVQIAEFVGLPGNCLWHKQLYTLPVHQNRMRRLPPSGRRSKMLKQSQLSLFRSI